MKFKKLIIKNIASIEEAEIDFENSALSTSGIFLITGKTGSGKTTILDSICLVLYNKVPRIENSKASNSDDSSESGVKIKNSRNLMRRGSVESSVSLTFTANDGNDYMAYWYCYRAHKRIDGSIQTAQRTITKLKDDKVIATGNQLDSKIIELIGLNFEQFLRTVMLSQGEFTRFLNSPDNEKAEILEKLTGVEIYSKIGKKIFEIRKDKSEKVELLRKTLEQYPKVDIEELNKKIADLKELETEFENKETVHNKEKAKYDWLKTSHELVTEYALKKEAYQKNQEIIQSEEFKKHENSVKKWQDTIAVRDKMTRSNALKGLILSLEGEICNYEQTYQRLVAGFRYLERKKTEKETLLNELRKNIPQQITHEEITKFLQNIASLKGSLENKKNLLGKILQSKEKISQLLEKISQSKEKISADLEPRLKALKSKCDEAEQLYEKQKDSVDKFAKSLRQTLKLGDVCPVCLQKIENALPIEEELFATVKTLKDNYDNAKQSFDKVLQEFNTLSTEIKTNEKICKKEQEDLKNDTSLQQCENRIAYFIKECGFNENISEEQITEAEETAKKTQRKITECNNLDISLVKIQTSYIDIKTKLSSIVERMPNWQNISIDDVFEVNDLQNQVNKLDRELTEKLSQLADKKADNFELETDIQDFLNKNQNFTKELLETINSVEESRIKKIEKAIQECKEQELTTKTNKEYVENQIKEHDSKKPDIEENQTIEELENNVKELAEQLRGVSEQKGELRKEIQTCQENLKKIENLNAEFKQAETEFLKWDRLNNFIGDSEGKKFRKIALSFILENLIRSANMYLKTLTDRYRLMVKPGTFVIELEDAYNSYSIRPVVTISGGESFLVSLSLALALSDIGQNLKLDILFIDEGFGTLSKEVLQSAIDTLSSLHNVVGRRVGVISHVEELQERIPVQIKVKQNGNTSSSTVEVVENAY